VTINTFNRLKGFQNTLYLLPDVFTFLSHDGLTLNFSSCLHNPTTVGQRDLLAPLKKQTLFNRNSPPPDSPPVSHSQLGRLASQSQDDAALSPHRPPQAAIWRHPPSPMPHLRQKRQIRIQILQVRWSTGSAPGRTRSLGRPFGKPVPQTRLPRSHQTCHLHCRSIAISGPCGNVREEYSDDEAAYTG
jgi:hypothetical protein